MFELLQSPWAASFESLLKIATQSLIICSPFIGFRPCQRVSNQLAHHPTSALHILVLTDLSRENMLSGATDVAALAQLMHLVPQTKVRFLPSLHAKVYIADEQRAIVTSGNFTDSGLLRNIEYGVLSNAPSIVRSIRDDVLRYALLGSPIDEAQLRVFASVVDDLREMRKTAERTIRSAIRREFDRRTRDMDDQILSVRAADRTPHAIFADTIHHLLRRGPMMTTELNLEIQRIHPDLCDDSIDRVINGQHFGKKWKHAVRTAQVYLRRKGEIRLVDRRWHSVHPAPPGR